MEKGSGTTRLPRHRALFYFSPEYLHSEEQWRSNFSALIGSLLRDAKHPWSVKDLFGAWTITVRFELTDFTIDARSGTFTVDEFNESEDIESWGVKEWVGPINSPEAFLNALSRSQLPKHLQSELEYVLIFARDLANRMLDRYRAALMEGHAACEARAGAIGNNFHSLDLDQIRQLVLVPWDREFEVGHVETELDNAKGPNGEMFYSVSIVPRTSRLTDSKKPPMPDGRRRYEWEKIDPVIKKHCAALKAGFPRKEIYRRTVGELQELGIAVPKPTILQDRIRLIISELPK